MYLHSNSLVGCSFQVCLVCHKLCREPAAMTLLYCAGCARPVHGCCRNEDQVFSHSPEEDAGLQRTCFSSSLYHASSLLCPHLASPTLFPLVSKSVWSASVCGCMATLQGFSSAHIAGQAYDDGKCNVQSCKLARCSHTHVLTSSAAVHATSPAT